MNKEDFDRIRELPNLMRDEEWRTLEQVVEEIDVEKPLVRAILTWLANEKENWERKIETTEGDKHGGGTLIISFRREIPVQRSLGDFV